MLPSIITLLAPDKPGLWWNAGTIAAPDFKKLNPRTLAWLDDNRPNWRNLASGTPQDYSIDGDIITLVPAPVSALAGSLWLYYAKKPTDMSADGHYPFSGITTEYPQLSIFDEAILRYAKWKVQESLNKDGADNFRVLENAYKTAREEAKGMFQRRPDISHIAMLQGPKVRA